MRFKELLEKQTDAPKKCNHIDIDEVGNRTGKKTPTTENIQKTILNRSVGKSINQREIREVYQSLYYEYYGRPVINPITEAVNNLLPHIREQTDPEINQFYAQLKILSKSSHAPVKIGAKLNVLQAILDIYSSTVILRGFRNPKTIVDISFDNGAIKQITFDDGTKFPEKYEFSTTELGFDLLDTFFFQSRNDLEKMVTTIGLIKPDNFKLGDKLLVENKNRNLDLQHEVDKFADWAKKILKLKTDPVIVLSMDTEEAQTNHHTGQHTEGDNKIWVYAKNRNLVDILRTIFHELTHVRQSELGMIKPGDSYPGSPIEVLADAMAGKYIKIYGEQHHYIFQ